MPRRREYMSCFGGECGRAQDDDTDIGYDKLDSSNQGDRVSYLHQRRGSADQNDYFRPVDSYQSSPADADQGQETEVSYEDQGSHNYSGVHVQRSKDKGKRKRKGLRAQVRHIIHSSWKWIRRGFIFVAPTMTANMTLNPTSSYVITTTAMTAIENRKSKKSVAL